MTNARLTSAVMCFTGEIEGDRTSIVPWWSVTKSILAADVMKLAEAEKLNLDQLYADWPFTIRQALQHTPGLINYRGEISVASAALSDTLVLVTTPSRQSMHSRTCLGAQLPLHSLVART